jgi:tellurite methyltransferase
VDGAPAAIETLGQRAAQRGLHIDIRLADLEQHQFTIEPDSYELILSAHYFQRDLIESAQRGLVPGGLLVVIALLAEPDRPPAPYRLRPGELRTFFAALEILYEHEGPVAEIIARRPVTIYGI